MLGSFRVLGFGLEFCDGLGLNDMGFGYGDFGIGTVVWVGFSVWIELGLRKICRF